MSRWHECPAPGCEVFVREAQLACKPHWFKLPKDLRERIWAAYDPDQTTMSDAYRAALGDAMTVWREGR